jgi:hypothetical protein
MPPSDAATGRKLVAADTHVHWYDCFDPTAFFDAAARNLDAAVTADPGSSRMDLLCLTDPHGRQSDVYLCETLRQSGSWHFTFSDDRASVCARHEQGRELHMLPGRQIVSRENIEVLALNCRCEPADRSLELGGLIDEIHAAGGYPVMPWGFGKWTGHRGDVLRGLLAKRTDLHLADSGNRCHGTREPALLAEGRHRGIAVMAGSDPLPLKRAERRAGTYGICARIAATATGADGLFRALMQQPGAWRLFGRPTSPLDFVMSQALLRIRPAPGRISPLPP